MLRILKVTGDSMSPDFSEGDFVLIARVPFFLRRLKTGDVVVFEHAQYGTLIKRVRSLDPGTSQVSVEGSGESSLDSRRLGPIRREAIRGIVIAHFPRH